MLTERKVQIAMSRIRDNAQFYELWENTDRDTKEFMLYLMIANDDQLEKLKKFMKNAMRLYV